MPVSSRTMGFDTVANTLLVTGNLNDELDEIGAITSNRLSKRTLQGILGSNRHSA
jgi:hypothetical protein